MNKVAGSGCRFNLGMALRDPKQGRDVVKKIDGQAARDAFDWTPKRLQAAKRFKSVATVARYRRAHGLTINVDALAWVIARVLLEAPEGPFAIGKVRIPREWPGLTFEALRQRIEKAGISRDEMPDDRMGRIMDDVAREAGDEFTALPDEDIGERMQLTAAEREACRVVLIEACDESRADRLIRQAPGKRAAKTVRQKALRRRKPRAEYIADRRANSAKHAQPWKAHGVSKATWYRHLRSKNTG